MFSGLFAEVEPGEGLACLLNFLNIFLILASYYVLKIVRDGLIVGGKKWFGLSGAEVKIYAAAAMAFLLLGVVPLYGFFASKVSRVKLINACYFVVIGFLGLFFVLGNAGMNLGLAFFLWLGIVNVFLISQFWQFANDIYDKAQGERLFAIIAIGGSLGAILGPLIAKLHDNVYILMVAAGAILLLCLFLFNTVNRLMGQAASSDGGDDDDEAPQRRHQEAAQEHHGCQRRHEGEAGKVHGGAEGEGRRPRRRRRRAPATSPLGKEGGFQLLLSQKYLLFIGLMVLVANLVNTTGEFILGDAAETYAAEQVPIPARRASRARHPPRRLGRRGHPRAALRDHEADQRRSVPLPRRTSTPTSFST